MATIVSRWAVGALIGAAVWGCASPHDPDVDPGVSDGSVGDAETDAGAEPVPFEGALDDLRFLTRTQYTNTVRHLLGFESRIEGFLLADDRIGPFAASGMHAMSASRAETFVVAAERVADVAIDEHLAEISPCGVDGDEACARTFLETFGKRAFRRPLSSDEMDALVEVYREGAADGGFPEGMRSVVASVLAAPSFLYLVETTAEGEAPTPLSGYELASRLSYFLWSSMPDDALLEAAENGTLDTPEGLRAQAMRLLEDPRGGDAIRSFTEQWLSLDRLPTMTRHPRYVFFDAEVAAAMRRESVRFVDHVIRKGDGTLYTLLRGQFSFLEEPLFPIYGMSVPGDFDPEAPISLLSDERMGLLTQAGFLTAQSAPDHGWPSRRGRVILARLLCDPIYEAIPHDFPVPSLGEPPEGVSEREFLELSTASSAACAACHSAIDPLGFAFENFDAVGSYRTMDLFGQAIDTKVEIATGDPSIDGPLDGPFELIEKLLDSPRLHACMVKQWMRFALGRELQDFDHASSAAVEEDFIDANYNFRELLLSVVTQDSFRMRPAAGR